MSVALHSDSADDFLRENRQRDIENMQRTSERLTAAAINRSTKRHPRAAKLALRGLSKGLANLDYQGNGFWSSVYRSHGQVIKVLRNTVQMTEQERQQFAQERNEMCSRAATVLGSLLFPKIIRLAYILLVTTMLSSPDKTISRDHHSIYSEQIPQSFVLHKLPTSVKLLPRGKPNSRILLPQLLYSTTSRQRFRI